MLHSITTFHIHQFLKTVFNMAQQIWKRLEFWWPQAKSSSGRDDLRILSWFPVLSNIDTWIISSYIQEHVMPQMMAFFTILIESFFHGVHRSQYIISD
jgi:hypothetical protein